jgi:predicted transposase YbfD/YdcC
MPLDAAIGAFVWARTPPPAEPETKAGPVWRVIAVDGKVVRGSRSKIATAIQLLAAMDHHGVVLAQRQVASKSNEIPSFAPMLDGVDLQNSVVTADAPHTQHDHGAYPTGAQHPRPRPPPRRDPPAQSRRVQPPGLSRCPAGDPSGAVAARLEHREAGRQTRYLITNLGLFDATCTELATWIRDH